MNKLICCRASDDPEKTKTSYLEESQPVHGNKIVLPCYPVINGTSMPFWCSCDVRFVSYLRKPPLKAIWQIYVGLAAGELCEDNFPSRLVCMHTPLFNPYLRNNAFWHTTVGTLIQNLCYFTLIFKITSSSPFSKTIQYPPTHPLQRSQSGWMNQTVCQPPVPMTWRRSAFCRPAPLADGSPSTRRRSSTTARKRRRRAAGQTSTHKHAQIDTHSCPLSPLLLCALINSPICT